ncbi:hypothetical protein [Pseudomonas sp. B22129]|uniref:hypothetical protein n=1 Tax=Pseudomonas sp. B22129 TaxID=3235111 RepID=UPI003784C442
MKAAMLYDVEEVYSQSIMTKMPIIIVEGVDDVPLYDRICNSKSKRASVFAVETLEGFGQGCISLIKAMDKVKGLPESKFDPQDFIAGMIDKDVRDFRGEIPRNDLVFVLRHYSIESHFVFPDILESLLAYSTRTTSDLRSPALISSIADCVGRSFEVLYLASLEALKGALDPTYFSDVSYSYPYGRVKDLALIKKIKQKEADLLNFAELHGLQFDLHSLRMMSRGKWLLSVFCEEVERAILELPASCKAGAVAKCQFCVAVAHEQCLYKLKDGISGKNLKIFAMQHTDMPSFDYIRSKVDSMYEAVHGL